MKGFSLAAWLSPAKIEYIKDFGPVPGDRYRVAQAAEREFWEGETGEVLQLRAQYRYYCGFYELQERGVLLNPFRVNPERPDSFQFEVADVEGRRVLDLGCGPAPHTISLVHCCEVHVLDPLITFYRELQPFGWDEFATVARAGGEELPYPDDSFDIVHCRNALDHMQHAERAIRETVRVLRPGGQFLLGCDVRGSVGGGPPHPYKWSIDAFESMIFRDFRPVTEIALLESGAGPVPREGNLDKRLFWTCRLEKRAGGRPA